MSGIMMKTKSTMNYNKWEIVLVPFPFTDESEDSTALTRKGVIPASTLFIIAICLFFQSCSFNGARLPAYFEEPDSHPDYPPARYVTAAASSSTSARAAEEKAKAAVSAGLRSNIESVFELYTHEVETVGGMEFQQEIRERIVVKSGFSHAEMIRCEPSVSVGNTHYAFAYISRKQAAEILAEEYETASVPFRKYCIMAVSTLELPAFTNVYGKIRSRFADLTGKHLEIRALSRSGRSPGSSPVISSYRDDLYLYRKVEEERATILASLMFRVSIEDCEYNLLEESLLGSVSGALHGMKLASVPGGCSPKSYHLLVKPQLAWPYCGFGELCHLRLGLVLKECDSGRTLFETKLAHPDFRGLHSRDKTMAVSDLVKNLTPEALEELLADCLRGVLPL